jgi:general secretion pathway protein N
VTLMARVLVLSAFLLFAAAVLFPLRLAGLEHIGVTARAAEGTIWRGRLLAAQIRGVPLGDLDIQLWPTPLLGGKFQATFAGNGLSGSMSKQAGSIGFSGLNGRTAPMSVGGLPVAAIEFYNVDFGFVGRSCTTASGQVRVRLVKGLTTGADLTGSPQCDGATIVLPLASDSGQVRLTLKIDAVGHYQATLSLDGVSEAQRPSLLVAGFRQTPTGLVMTREGAL